MKGSLERVIGFCCACIAFYIGAGFATMQEVMQYEASYGSQFWIVIAVAAVIYLYTNWSFTVNGHRENLLRGGDIYNVYCGKWIGKIFNYFSALFCYMCFIVMCGGANSTAMEQWGMPNGIGAVILAIATISTVYFGLNNMLKVLKWVGPMIIILILMIAGVTAIMGWENFTAGLRIVDSKQYEIVQVGDGNPFASGASYGGFVILWFATFMAELGAKNNVKEVNTGMALSTIAIFSAAAVCCVALIANINNTWNVGIPALVLARQIHPVFASVFAIIIYLGIFSSACPLLWTGVRKVSEDGTKGYKIATIVGGIFGLIVACLVPYKGVLNVIYGLNGYLGFILVAFMIVKDIRVFIAEKKSMLKTDVIDEWDKELRSRKHIVFCGDHYNPLNIIRSLGEKGIRPYVILMGGGGKKPIMINHSCYPRKLHIVTTYEEGYKILQGEYGYEDKKPFIYCSDDKTMCFLDKHYDALFEKFIFYNAGQQGRIEWLQNKDNITTLGAEAGLDNPKKEVVNTGVLPTTLKYPIITKVLASTMGAWKGDVYICKNEAELKDAYNKIKSPKLIIQEYVNKVGEFCMEGFSINDGHDIFIPYIADYIRYYNNSYGHYMNMIPFEECQLKERIKELFKLTKYNGIFEIEFMKGPDSKSYFLEINFRASTWNYALTVGGGNLPYFWAKSMLAGRILLEEMELRDKPFKAMVEPEDFLNNVVVYKTVGFKQWIKELRGVECYYYYNKKDRSPFIYYILDLFKQKIKRFLHV